MAGKTKTLGTFNHGVPKQFEVSSSLDNVFISNYHSIDIVVQMILAIDGYADVPLLINTHIPPGVTLNILENQALRIKNQKSFIKYTCADNADNKMGVVYTAQ
jgi:hypothetical protein